jgi:predicted outer membrane repeat protein
VVLLVGETSLVQRDWENNETILSGDINQTGDLDGNSYTVVNGSNTNNLAVLDGFTIIMGNANFGSGSDSNPNRSGGGLYNNNGSPTIANCYITGNFAVQDGAGIFNINSASPTLNNCVVSNNTADDDGGGIYNENNSSPAISDCIITANVGVSLGGGIRNENNSNPTITNSIISGNQAFSGGGILNWGESSPSIINSTISGNEADFLGGGIYNFASSNPSVINSTISGNKADTDGGGIYNESESNPIIINSIIWNNSANGLTSSVSASILNENLSNPQISYSIIANSGGSSSWDTNTGNDLGSNIDLDPLFVEDVDLGNLPTSDGDLRLTNCSPAIDAGNPDTTGLNLPDLDLDGNSRIFNATEIPGDVIDMGAYEFQSTVPVDRPNTLYVNADNPTPGKGRSWECAFTSLQDALAVAEAGDSIWVAAGTYLPTPGSDRNISFLLKNGVSIYGGFTGTETQLDQRDWENNATILSGDIGVQGDAADNSFHVLRAGNGVTEALLDGFTVTGGNANGGGTNVQGAGMRIFGGASVDVANCRFENNFAEDRGAGIKVLSATANIRNSLFENNSSDIGAGILVNTSSVVNLEYCIFRNNTADVRGGGIFYNSSSGELRNCLFYDNSAVTEGGAIMMAVGATVNIINSTIANNDAPTGGGILSPGSSATVANSIFWNNNQQFGQGGNINATYSILEGTYSGTGIISSDPLFTDPGNGDYSLQQCSPAIDAGNNNVVNPSDTLDLAGNLRLFDATELGSPTVDMGAYEYQDVVPAAGNPNVIYVDVSNPSAGSGVSWACAFTDLQDALAVAEAGDSIWVAQGTYRPTNDLDREVYFELKEGVVVLGGFDGTEGNASQRNWENNETILDGDIDGSGNSTNNSYLIVFASLVDSTTVLDGFTIQGANNPGGTSIGGGGMEIQDGAPVIRNCSFVNNSSSFEGAGIFISSSSPTIVNCTIADNSVGEGGVGAGVFALESNPTFVDCHFENNDAFFGSGLYAIESNVVIENTTFTQHSANDTGGALYLSEFSHASISNSTFTDNTSGSGGAIYSDKSHFNITGSTFTDNSANFDGGAIALELSSDTSTIDSTLFTDNSAENGGAIGIIEIGAIVATDCNFTENTASGFGGGLYVNDFSSVELINCTLDQNSAESGGGMKVLESTATIKNSIFHSNTADLEGGAIMSASASLLMINSTIADNSSPAGGGLKSSGGSSTIANSIFWGNVEQINSNGTSITASQSIVEGGFAGAGIMTADPLFSDSDANDYSLQACSPAIDAGDNVFLSASDTLDLAGNPRIFNATGLPQATVDIGAFEFQGTASAPGNPNVIYVDIDNPSPGAGTSWNCSFDDLQDALAIAQAGDTIWVAEGVYRPNLNSDQEISFELKSGVVILGGFNGTETDPTERDWEMYPVVLDGDVNLNGGSFGKSFQIVRAVDVDSTAVLDGVTIQGGSALGIDQSSGGGIYIENSSPILRNLIIQNCFGFSGGGAWVGDSSSAVFYNCTFIENNVSEGSPGGGVLVINSSAEFLNCTFTDNNAFFGGAIANLGSSILVDSSIFSINSSAMNGAGVFNDNSAQLFVYESEFNGNSAFQRGGALYFSNNSSGVIEDCSFFDNSASVDGGAVFSTQSSEVHLSGSNLQENSAEFGGAISTQGGAITNVNNCFFQGNSSTNVGGAILSQNPFTYTSIDSSEFTGNYAVGAGGALAVLNEATADCDNSVFEENNSEANGGAIVFWNQSSGTVQNSHFQFNSAEGTGGAINISNTNFSSQVINCSFTANGSLLSGGAIYSSTSNLVLLGAELSGNLAIDGAGLYFSGDSLFVDSTLFSMNGATGNGGGLFFGGHFGQLDETIFTENTADIGGGIYNVGDFLNVFNSDIMENSAIKEGGGVYAEDSHTKMKKSKIDKNQAEMGGGFYGKKGELKKEKSKIRENLADKGAGVYFMKGKFDMDSVEISDNIAQQKGGGFYSDSTEVSFENSQINKNQAMQEGGGFYKFKGEMMMKDTDLEENEAMKGGGGYKKQAKAYFEKNEVFEKCSRGRRWWNLLR